MRTSLASVGSVALTLALLSTGCGDDSSDGPPGSGGGGVGGGGTGAGTGTFNPDDPGIHTMLQLGAITMLGQPMELAMAAFMPAAREDFEPEPGGESIPIDTCVVVDGQPATPSCTTAADCAPEQDCLPETDDGGAPIAGTERCVTDRELMDVGPLTLEGLATGPTELTFNAGQSGAYTVPGTDGTLQGGTLAFDTTYSFHGAGDAAQGLGAFSGELYLAPAMQLTSPPMVELGMPGMMGIEANPDQDLVLVWSGANANGELELNLTGGQSETSVDCRVTDDGEFTIPAAMVQAAGLGDIAFMNMLLIDRQGSGTATGDGITYTDVGVLQTSLINVAKVQ